MHKVENYPISLEFFKAIARPTLIYALGLCQILLTLCICYVLLFDKAKLADASAIIITFFSTSMPIIAAIVVGRSYEKGKGADGFFPGINPIAPPPIVKTPNQVVSTTSVSTATPTQTTLPTPQSAKGAFDDPFK